jgi:UDP-2-acetamido-3-amino-2,3-dideoxy-glucuronate N-acetyltransferase
LIKPHAVKKTRVPGVTLHRLRRVHDPRGNLCVGEFAKDIPFLPRRFFMVFDVPNAKHRGEHAHKRCHQFLVCMAGSLSVQVKDGARSQIFHLKPQTEGVYVPPKVWCSQYNFRPGTVLLVFASAFYEASDYIRSYEDFVRFTARSGGTRVKKR